jgi:hypothetical protein
VIRGGKVVRLRGLRRFGETAFALDHERRWLAALDDFRNWLIREAA